MTRKNAKELLPIIQAFAEGKSMQRVNSLGVRSNVTGDVLFYYNPEYYRIKPEPEYRPFKNQEEFWQEMMKHQPFGWVKWNDVRYNIYVVSSTSVCLINGNCENMDFAYAYQKLTFADGTPFGVKVE